MCHTSIFTLGGATTLFDLVPKVAVVDRRVRSPRARFGDAAAYSLQRALADLHRTMFHLQVI